MNSKVSSDSSIPLIGDKTPRNIEYIKGRGTYSSTIQSGYSGRLAKIYRNVPASAMAGAQWATRNDSTSSGNDPTESLRLRLTTCSAGESSTPAMPKSTSMFSTSSSNLVCNFSKGGSSSSSFTPKMARMKPSKSTTSASLSRRGHSTSSSGGRGRGGLFTPPMAPPPPPRKSSMFSITPPSQRASGDISIITSRSRSSHYLSDSSSITSRKRVASGTSRSGNATKDGLDLDNDIMQDGASSRDQSTVEEPNQIVMSLSWAYGNLGAAFYDINSAQVYMVEDRIEAASDFWILRTLFREQRPRWALVGGRIDDRLFKVLRELCGMPNTPLALSRACLQKPTSSENMSSADEVSAGSPTASSSGVASCTLRVLPMSDFKYELCLRRVLSLILPGEPEGITERERELFVRGRVNTDLVQMTRALGALVRFIDKHGMDVVSPTNLIDGTSILGLHVYAMEQLAQMDDVTASALQLFSEDQHPAAFKSGKSSASKEGLSVYALLSRTACPMASHTLSRILLRPMIDANTLEARYALVGWGVEPANLETVKNLQSSMKKIINVPQVMNRLYRGLLNVRDWKVLHNSLFNAILVGELCQAQDQEIPIFKQMGDCVTEGLYHASFLIQRIMDMEQSEREGRFVVKPGVDNDLDDKKRRYSGLGDVMRQVAQTELSRLPPEIESCSIIYLPHVGYLLAFPPTLELDQTLPSNDYQLPGLEFMFRTADLVLYKSFTCCEMDRELGDIQVEIANHETRIMMRLMETLMQQAQTFMALVDNILTLDCLLAFSVVSRECGWVKPELTEELVLEIENARHPLYELCTPAFVSNPIRSGPPYPCVTLITGPNASGKTVYLKQVGVLVVLAQIGCWVPASRARLKPLDAIITVTQSIPPVMSTLSAFMLDLSRMCIALSKATRHSLVIIDEFGAATYENDGAALLTACLDYYCQRSKPRYSTPPPEDNDSPFAAPPHVFVSTHLLQVYDHLQYQDAVRPLALEAVEEDGGVVPLYQITEGRAHKSYAAEVAALGGIPQQVVDRANQVCACICSGKLPPKWSLLQNDEEHSRCETIVSLLLSYDLVRGPLDVLFDKIRSYARPPAGLSTPGTRTPSDISGQTAHKTHSDTKSTNKTTASSSRKSSIKPKDTLGKPSPDVSNVVVGDITESIGIAEGMNSSLENDDAASETSSTPLAWRVEAVLSPGTSDNMKNSPKGDSSSGRYLSPIKHPPCKGSKKGSKSTTSSSISSKSLRTTTPLPSIEGGSGSSCKESWIPSDASTVIFRNKRESKETRRHGKSHSNLDITSYQKTDEETCLHSSQDQESSTDYSCSQESVILTTRRFSRRHNKQTTTQSFQPGSEIDIEF